MPTQKCSGCGFLNDVSIFVSGQRVRCGGCTLAFTVRRSDSKIEEPAGAQVARQAAGRPVQRRVGGGAEAQRQRPVIRPHPAVEQAEARARARPKGAQAAAQEAAQPAARPAVEPAGGDTNPRLADLVLPGFELFEVIGKGGMGKVYRATQKSLNRMVAIKVLNEDLAKHKSFIKRFEKETASLAALNHPNISSIIDRGNVGSSWYFVMEYIDGPSMRHHCNRPHADLNHTLGLFICLCRAMGHAHQRGVIHRDLKPENVLFTADGVLKVVDFGLANILDDERRWSMTRTKVSMGTVNYMAPEQRRDAKNVDQRADIYSLGVMLYELMAGELPLGRFDPPSKHRAGLDTRIDRLVLKMLDFDPDERPQQAELVAASLESIAGSLGAETRAGADPGQASPEAPDKPRGPGGPVEPPAGPAQPVRNSAIPTPMPENSRVGPRSRSRKPGLRSLLLFLVGGLVILVGGAVAVFSALLASDLSNARGDLVLGDAQGKPQFNLVHPLQIKHIPPQSIQDKDGRRLVRFDFKPSRNDSVSVRLVGGDWQLKDRLGALVQDTCRSKFTINQHPATAAFGAPGAAEGLQLNAQVEVGPSYTDLDGERVPMQRYLTDKLSGLEQMAQVDSAEWVGLGFVDQHGDGLQVMLPVGAGSAGHVLRVGKGMERKSAEFSLGGKALKTGAAQSLQLRIADGRLTLSLDEQVLFEDLSGLPFQFRGTPALACQNAVCKFTQVEIWR